MSPRCGGGRTWRRVWRRWRRRWSAAVRFREASKAESTCWQESDSTSTRLDAFIPPFPRHGQQRWQPSSDRHTPLHGESEASTGSAQAVHRTDYTGTFVTPYKDTAPSGITGQFHSLSGRSGVGSPPQRCPDTGRRAPYHGGLPHPLPTGVSSERRRSQKPPSARARRR